MRTQSYVALLLPLLLACEDPVQGGDATDLDPSPDLLVAGDSQMDLSQPAEPSSDLLAQTPDMTTVDPPDRIRIPAGRLTMGSDTGDTDERPVHDVTVAAFLLDRTEVTQGAYKSCVAKGVCTEPNSQNSEEWLRKWCNWGQSGKDDHPVNCIDWQQAETYCGFVGGRLPTEEEWEYAARGASKATYPWGASAPGNLACWNRWKDGSGTCAIGGFEKTLFGQKDPAGLLDLGGNVWEWTQSRYCKYTATGRQDCMISARVVRGASWSSDEATLLRAANRRKLEPSERYDNVGVRCAYPVF